MAQELFTLREAAEKLGVTYHQVKYATMTRPIPRRRVGRVDLVTLDDMQRGLASVDPTYNWRARRANG